MTTITPTYQTATGTDVAAGVGNCMVASVATITGIPLSDIPHFVEAYLTESGNEVDTMENGDWLNVLWLVMQWLSENGFDSAECGRMESAALPYGAPVYTCLALVLSTLHGDPVPHIIVTDQRGMQMWDPNPAATAPYQPTDVLAMLVVMKQ